MSERDSSSAVRVIGTGEFQRRNLHVIATVEMRGETICGVGFAALPEGEPVPASASELEALLANREVHDALQLLAADREAGDRGVSEEREVLIEAFHRAVESCLDQQ
jgi:hypothetical protein